MTTLYRGAILAAGGAGPGAGVLRVLAGSALAPGWRRLGGAWAAVRGARGESQAEVRTALSSCAPAGRR